MRQLSTVCIFLLCVAAFTLETAAQHAGEFRLVKSGPGLVPLAPTNDQCAGAETIPAAGPFPYLTSVVNIASATTTSDPPAPACQTYVSRSVWYAFKPAVTGTYTIATCGTATTMEDNVMAVYTSANGCAGSFAPVPGACSDDACGAGSYLASLTRALSQDTTYSIVVWKYNPSAPASGKGDLQLLVEKNDPPANDVCASAVPLPLNRAVFGTTAWARNDYQLSGQACYTGLQQNASIAAGGEVVYAFTAPAAGTYSFKVSQYSLQTNLVVYVASACPSGQAPATVTACLGASNRSLQSSSEEVLCVSLTQNQQVYVFVDEHAAGAGSAFVVEATQCQRETEPNGTAATANALVQGLTGAITPNSEADFYALGTPSSGSRIFAMVDGSAGSVTDFDLRVTTATDVLEYDDADNDTPFGAASPNIAGRAATGAPTFLRVNQFSTGDVSEPYKLYAIVQPPFAGAVTETEPNNAVSSANQSAGNYFSASLSGPAPSADVDWYGFMAQAGDLIFISLDGDPLRDNTPLNAALALTDASGTVLTAINDGAAASSTSASTGNLSATTPYSPGEGLVLRAPATDVYYVRVSAGSNVAGPSTAGDYLLSLSKNGATGGGGLPSDIAVTLGGPDTAASNYPATYTLTVTNNGPSAASHIVVIDSIQAGTTFLSLTSAGACTTPAVGGTGLVTCAFPSLAPGASITMTLRLMVTAATGSTITNRARASADQPDIVPVNNVATRSSAVALQAADLAIAVSTTQDSVIASAQWTYAFTVSNLGPNLAQSVIVSDTIGGGARFQSVSAPAGWTISTPAVGSAGIITATRASFAAASSSAFTVTVTADPLIAHLAQIRHCVSVAAVTLDPDKTNNRGCVSATAINRPPRIDAAGGLALVQFGCKYPKEPSIFAKEVVIGNANTAYNVAAMTWTATTSAPEITLSNATGDEGGKLAFTVNTAGLAVGTHTRIITVSAANGSTGVPADNSPLQFLVRIEIQPAPAAVVTQTRTVGASWTPFTNPLGQLMAEVRSNGGAIANFSVTTHPCDMTQGISRMAYANRYFVLSAPVANPDVDIRFYYTGNELEPFRVADPSQLRAWRQYPAPGVWRPTTSTSDPLTNSVTATGVTDLRDIWAVAAPYSLAPMPARGSGWRHADGSAELRWTTGMRPSGAAFVVERRAQPGAGWIPLSLLAQNARGEYAFADADTGNGPETAYRLFAVDDAGDGSVSDPVVPADGIALRSEAASIPADITLDQSVPNPLLLSQGTRTRIGYGLARDAFVTLTLHDALGREVRSILRREQAAGRHVAELDAADLPTGRYFTRLQSGTQTITRTLVVLR